MNIAILKQERAKHYDFIDIARFFGISGVLAIHASALYASKVDSGSVYILNQFSRFAVPLFIVISGFLHKRQPSVQAIRESMPSIILNKAKRLLIPYLSFSVLYLFIRIVIEHSGYFNNLFTMRDDDIASVLRAIFLVRDNPAGHLYFLPLLFFTTVLFIFMELLIKNIRTILFLSCLVSALAYNGWGDIYSSINPLKGLSFYALGYSLRNSNFASILSSLPTGLFYGAIWAALLFLIVQAKPANSVSIYTNRLWLYTYHLFSALSAFQVAAILTHAGLSKVSVISRGVKFISKYTFHIYLMHEPYILTVCFILLLKLSISQPFANQSILILVGMAVPLVMSFLFLDRVSLFRKYLFGEQR